MKYFNNETEISYGDMELWQRATICNIEPILRKLGDEYRIYVEEDSGVQVYLPSLRGFPHLIALEDTDEKVQAARLWTVLNILGDCLYNRVAPGDEKWWRTWWRYNRALKVAEAFKARDWGHKFAPRLLQLELEKLVPDLNK